MHLLLSLSSPVEQLATRSDDVADGRSVTQRTQGRGTGRKRDEAGKGDRNESRRPMATERETGGPAARL
jgi:hypothetical protein